MLTLSKPLKIQIVELARALIADERHWCRRHLAEDGNGVSVSPISSSAVKRCGLGAVIAAAYQLTHDFDTADKLGQEAIAPIGTLVTLMHVNDTRGHSAVLALFDEVIAAS
jgi:NifU-like protein involved in Fe-S cluster formation